MGTKYSSVAVSGYNSSPPADDGSQSASNLVKWSTHKTKIGDPLNTAIAAINAAVLTDTDTSCRAISSNDNAIAGDHKKTLEVTGTTTVTLGLAATMGAGYTVSVYNAGTGTVTVAPTATDTIDSSTSSVTLPSKTSKTFVVNSGTTGYNSIVNATPVPRGHLSGLTMSTAGSSATLSVAAGQATDSTNVLMMNLSSAISKTTSAWAVGSATGGLDTGAIANSTWYHFYLIQRLDTGVVDVVFSTSASSPTLPTNYTLYRRIGSAKTNGSAQWTKFVQFGDEFLWDTMTLDLNASALSATAQNATATVPTGVQVLARARVTLTTSGGGSVVLFSSLDESDQAPGTGTYSTVEAAAAGQNASCEILERTNTSAQIRWRSSNTNGTLSMATFGWIDRRGRDS